MEGRLEGVVVGRMVGGRGEALLLQLYQGGRRVGRGWRREEGGGWLHGALDYRGRVEGEGVVFLYPDLSTCLVGRWREGRMEEAREGVLVRVVEEEGRLLEVEGREVGEEVHTYSPSTCEALTVPPLLQDPYERR